MGKTIVQRKSTAPVAQDELDKRLSEMGAGSMFLSASVNMGWQLALTVLIPVFVGVKLDDRFHTAPSYTLAALVLAIGGAVFVVKSNIKQAQIKATSVKIKEKTKSAK